MAGESVVGALRVVLGIDTATFEDGIKNATGQIESFVGKFAKFAAPAAAISTFAALTAGILKTTESLDELGKSAQKAGIPVEEFTALKYAASLANVDVGTLTTSMGRLAKNMSEAAGGARGPASEAFLALGISVQNSSGKLKDSGDILGEIADKFAGFRDSASKTALAIAIFGRAGAEMIPLLNQGSAGLASAADEARRFGLIVSEETVKAAEEFNDNLKRLSAIMSGVVLQATAAVSNQLVTLSKLMLDIVNNSNGVSLAVTAIADIFKGFLGVIDLIAIAVDKVIKNFSLLVQAATAIATGDFAKLKDLFTQYVGNLTDAADKALNVAKSVTGLGTAFQFAGNAIGSFNQFAGKSPLTDAPIIATKTALDALINSTEKHIASVQAESDAFGQTAGVIANERLQLEANTVAKENHIKITDQMHDKLQDLGDALQLVTDKLVGQQLIQENLPFWDQYAQKIANADTALRAFGATDEQFTAEHVRLQGQAIAATSGFFGFLEQGAAAAASQNKQFAGTAKALSIAQATINTYEAATKAFNLFGGWPLGAAAAAATVAAGLALVAKITATGFATGGSFKVGGSGGIDSQLVTLAMTPGEMVDVKRPGQTGGGTSDVNLRGIAPDDFFTGRMLRNLVDALNQGHRDGYKLNFAE